MSITTIQESAEAQENLAQIQSDVKKWHETQKTKVLREVMLLRSMQTPLEKNTSFITKIADNALSLLKEIQEGGSAN